MTLTQVRKHALSLPDVIEEPHFERTSFRINGKIFLTAKASETHIHVFVPEQARDPAVAMHSDYLSKLLWGGKVVGLKVELPKAQLGVVKELIDVAWKSKAMKKNGKSSVQSRS